MASFSAKSMTMFFLFTIIFGFGFLHTSAELQRFTHTPKTDGSLNFLVIGDWGRRGEYNQSEVALQMGVVGEKLDIDFVVSTGDNFYDDGLTGEHDPNFEESFSKIYTAKSLQKQWYSELVEIFFVDTTPFVEEYFTVPEHHYDWNGVNPPQTYIANLLKDVEMALRESTAKWKIVVGHHAIRSAGHHGDTKELVNLLLPILQANHVDFYMNGHDHCLEHISDLSSPIQFLVSGAGSKAWRGDVRETTGNGVNFFYDGQGFMSVQLTRTDANIVFYDVSGQVLHKTTSSKQLHSSI